jgi:predicted 2-oxoglutarate/Fe(II)-dependent dioxygenase YbiX
MLTTPNALISRLKKHVQQQRAKYATLKQQQQTNTKHGETRMLLKKMKTALSAALLLFAAVLMLSIMAPFFIAFMLTGIIIFAVYLLNKPKP